MRKPAFCIYKNNGADSLHGNRAADLYLSFRFIDSTIPLLPNSKPLAIFYGCTALFVSDLVGNPKDMFYSDAAHILFSESLYTVSSRLCDSVTPPCTS